jgi:homoserine O-acetyltransferase/O-succinyltransferase
MSQTISTNPDGSFVYRSNSPFSLASGEALGALELVFETWGELNADKSNVVLIHHALSVGAHVTSSANNSAEGWWQDMVGPGKAIDTDRYFVICINNLGSCFGSSGPTSINPVTVFHWFQLVIWLIRKNSCSTF